MVFQQNQNLTVWFRCHLCRASFQNVDEFVKHKELLHLAELQKINSNCIIFEEVTAPSNQNQKHVADEIPATTTVNTSDVRSRTQTEIKAGPEPEPDSENEVAALQGPASLPILTPALNTAKEKIEIVQLITYDNDNDIENDKGQQMIEIERTQAQTFPKVNNPSVLLTRLTLKEIQAASSPQSRLSSNCPKSNTSSVSKPRRKASKPKSFKCPKAGCFKIFKTLWSRRMHFATHTKSKSNDRQQDKPFHCEHPGCGKSFKRIDGLKGHLETHINPGDRRTFPCQICSKMCFRKKYLDTHYREVHGSARPFTCPQPGCMKSFKRKEAATAHFETHADPRIRPTFPCQICSKTFLRTKYLNKHYREVHGKDLPAFPCPLPGCTKSFKRRVAVRAHFETHVDPNARPVFACKICQLPYWHLESLKKHCLVVHRVYP